MEVVAGAHVYPADPIGVQWDSSPATWKAWKHIDVVLLKVVHCYTRCVWPSVVLVGITTSVGQLRA